MSKKYKTLIFIILVLLFISSGIGIFYFFRDKNPGQEAIVIKLKNLSINYLEGNEIKTTENLNEVNFSVTNNSDNDLFYNIQILNIKNYNDKIQLELNNDTNNTLNLKLKDKKETKISSGIKIVPNETHNYKILIDNPNKLVSNFEIKVEEEIIEEAKIAKTIINNNVVKSSPQTKIGEEAAVNAEGLISDIDDSGITYYFRGNVSNNYFSFADKMWRIVRINGDGTVRLILDQNIEVLEKFNDYPAEYIETNISKSLEEWYNVNLFQYEEDIYEGEYCYDNKISSDGVLYTAYNRIFIAKLPSFNCESKIASKIGLLSLDEALYAGLNINSNNTTNYLYNEKNSNWWTMTSAKLDSDIFYPFSVRTDGSIASDINANNSQGLRPVINLSFSLKVEGEGTLNNPYKIIK